MIQHTISLSLRQEINLSLINTTLRFGGYKRSGFAEGLKPGGLVSTIVNLTVPSKGFISSLGSLMLSSRVTGRASINGWVFIEKLVS